MYQVWSKSIEGPLKDVDPRVFTRIVTDGRKVVYYIPSQLRWRGDKKGCTRLTVASDKVYQLLAEILLKVALNTKNQSLYMIQYIFLHPL